MGRPFQPGNDPRRNVAGRPEGSHNKRTLRLNDLFENANFSFAKEYARCLMALPEKERLAEMKYLLPYIAPQLQSITFAAMSPEESVDNAKRLMDELKLIEDANARSQS